MVSSSSISSWAGVSVSLIGCPSNRNRICLIDKPCLSQYAFISLLSGVCLLILNCTTEPSCPATFRLMWSFSVFTPSLGFSSDMVAQRRRRREAQREPVALEQASHALCPAALPPQLSRGRALSPNPGAPVGRAASRGGARARCACPAPRVRAGRPRFRTVVTASRGGSGTRARAEPRERATQGPGYGDP